MVCYICHVTFCTLQWRHMSNICRLNPLATRLFVYQFVRPNVKGNINGAIWRGVFFFFNDSCLLLVQFYQLPPRYFFNFELPRSLPFLSNERKHQRYALLAICEWIPPMDSSYNAESVSISWCHHERCIMIIISTWYWDLIIFVTVVSMIIELRGFVYIYILNIHE